MANACPEIVEGCAGIVQGKKMAANQIIEGQGCAFTEVVNALQPVVCFKVPHSYCWIAMEVELLEVLQDASPALVGRQELSAGV